MLAASAVAVIAIVLAAGFAYSYFTTANQVSSLKSAGSKECQEVSSLATRLEPLFSDVYLTLQSQILSDNSLIQSLNSTRPAGYSGMISSLNNQITQDLAIEANMTSLQSPSASLQGPNPCVTFNQP